MMLESLSGLLALAAAAMAAAGEPKWTTYESATGLYSIDHPGDWTVERHDNVINILPGDDSGAVTISAYLGTVAPDAPKELIAKAFRAYQPTSPAIAVAGSGWKGVRRAFHDATANPQRALTVLIARGTAGMVIVTWNEVAPAREQMAPVHARVFESLKLAKRKR